MLKEDCPEWLSWGILASIGASFGLKSIGVMRWPFFLLEVFFDFVVHLDEVGEGLSGLCLMPGGTLWCIVLTHHIHNLPPT